MKTKRLLGLILLAAGLTVGVAHGQSPSQKPAYPAPSPIQPEGPPNEIPQSAYSGDLSGLSDWILYRRDCCEGKGCRLTPLYTEVYLRSGPSFPVGGQTLSRELNTGWSVMGGARALFFNEQLTRAWAIDLHLISTFEQGEPGGNAFPITIFRGSTREDFGVGGTPGVTVRRSNRTMVGLGAGREYYLWQPADTEGRKWRVGFDGGGRYGSHKLDFYETRHITDVVGAIYLAVHSDLEFMCCHTLWHTGVRLEWAYTWSDILRRESDVQDINLLFTVGVRY